MRINLLSEVTAYADGGDTDLLAALRPMPRLFVAALALSPGRPVVMDRLAEQLWGADLPADPRGQLYSCVARARAALRGAGTGDAGADLVITRAGGYCLQIDRQSVDVGRFHAKAADARGHADQDDAVAALAREALLEWGPVPTRLYGPEPLAGLPGQWAANYRVTLRREHRDVLIELLAAEIRGGGADRALAEFGKLADADAEAQEDEKLTALLMHAYYVCGRQAEALKAYQRTTESLKRKGVEAGRELRVMEKKVRNQDPGLDYPPAVVIPARDLMPTAGGHSDDQDGDATAPDAGPDERGDPGSGTASSPESTATYSQRNIGRTVVANQGTQHVNLGGSDE